MSLITLTFEQSLANSNGKEGVSGGLEEPGSDENHRNTGSDGQQSDENGYEGK